MTDKTQTPASDAATPATTQPTEPVETEDTTMTEPKAAAPDPKVAASETAQPAEDAGNSRARHRSGRHPRPRGRARPRLHHLRSGRAG